MFAKIWNLSRYSLYSICTLNPHCPWQRGVSHIRIVRDRNHSKIKSFLSRTRGAITVKQEGTTTNSFQNLPSSYSRRRYKIIHLLVNSTKAGQHILLFFLNWVPKLNFLLGWNEILIFSHKSRVTYWRKNYANIGYWAVLCGNICKGSLSIS